MFDVIIIGAGPGGLVCATNLAKSGYSVLVLEKNFFVGGTSYAFRRNGYTFPMGPLGFSSLPEVKTLLKNLAIEDQFTYTRNQYQLIAPDLNIIFSKPFEELRAELISRYESEEEGINHFFRAMENLANAIKHLYEWHPRYIFTKDGDFNHDDEAHRTAFELIERSRRLPAKVFLDKEINNRTLYRFLGSLGTTEPKMSMLLLGIMWALLSKDGIWYPSGGIHGILQALQQHYIKFGGELQLGTKVTNILVQEGRAIGVKTQKRDLMQAKWIVSNADYKSTFLRLIDPNQIPNTFRSMIKDTSYFGSEFCVYLGIDPQKIELSNISADHVFYRKALKLEEISDVEDFENREIEICFWSNKAPESAPPGKMTVLLRIAFPYDHFTKWKVSDLKRKEGYREYKIALANKLIKTVETLIPRLGSSIELMEVATPLTYEDFGQRFHGSIAGWSWAAEDIIKTSSTLLLETPIENLLMCGLYASTELFLGGVPTSLYTGYWAAEIIKEKRKKIEKKN
ncbi:MAG: NAD(P)/FAD-dependent oxidoreductase [Promethearchaeota archaeon]|nr:MAG: NAD(P)/FAD-dependent oxidoreductase [Candidatus Lokiarchaeota archaeon]